MKRSMYFEDLTLDKLTNIVKEWGKPAFNSKNLYRWFYKRSVRDYSLMSDVSKELREKLSLQYIPYSLKLIETENSKDGCVKFLFELQDKETIESVLIPKEDRLTLCVSTQVGCKMGCTFCCTAKQGLSRSLACSEIVAQIQFTNTYARDVLKKAVDDGGYRAVTNIVFMGMGEPLDNMDNVIDAITVISDDNGLAFGLRKITVSTCGLVPKIFEFRDRCNAKLAISLNAITDDVRDKIMPVNKAYPIKELLKVIKSVGSRKQDFVTIEYILFGGLNDSKQDAVSLSKLLKGLNVKVNLIPFNFNPMTPELVSPTDKSIYDFYEVLVEKGIVCNVRHSRGIDINAACGQLKSKKKGI
ncbi:MAG TPA: 23S rRNA (adenine(2503)-C(2))-methyltransferase RlmN [bacterium]|nr:23S rRNA (adenine(2503)-C(2))-methyltransferase RlmN [bacterium]